MTQSSPKPAKQPWWIGVIGLPAGAAMLAYAHAKLICEAGFATTPKIAIVGGVDGLLFFMVHAFEPPALEVAVQGNGCAIALLAGVVQGVGIDKIFPPSVPPLHYRGQAYPKWAYRDFSLTPPSPLKIVVGPTDFPRFLGSRGTGRIDGIELATDWKMQSPRQVWLQPIGDGTGGFVVVDNCAITQEQRDDYELVSCYDLRTGKPLWIHQDQAMFEDGAIGEGPRATPCVADGKVYAMGATGLLNCLDAATGKVLWSHDVLAEHGQNNLSYGKSCSPLVVDDKVVVTLGSAPSPSLAAYDRNTGKLLWDAGRDMASYASPIVATLAGKRQIISVNNASVCAHDPDDGHILWEYPWAGGGPGANKCTQPIALSGDRVFLSTGYGVGCVMLRITAQSGGPLIASELWKKPYMKTQFSNVVVRDHYVYGLDEGILCCVDLDNGSRQSKGDRYGSGQMLLVNDLLVISSDSGWVALVRADPKQMQELARFPALQSGRVYNHPAMAGAMLLVRNNQQAACFELPLRQTPAATTASR